MESRSPSLLAVVGTAVCLGATATAFALLRSRRFRLPEPGLPARRPPPSYVTRTPNGRVGGLQAFRSEDTGVDDITFADMLELERVVLYCVDVEQGLLIFLRISKDADLASAPFLDRGVRRFCDDKDYAYITSFDTARDHLRLWRPPIDPERLIFIWNTGRCGSTLLHRLLLQAGVCSLSEPYWYEQLARCATEQDPSEAGELLELCCRIDFPLTRRVLLPPEAAGAWFALNGKAFGHSLLEPVIHKYPEARHFFMYRDPVEVVESFQSIFLQDVPFWQRLYFLYCCPPPATSKDLTSDGLRRKLEHGELPIPFKRAAARNALMWLDGVCTWMEVMRRYPLLRAGHKTMVLRMTEFTDPRRRQEVVEGVLRFALGKDYSESDEATKRYSKVFNQHSQQGDRMQRSSSQPGVGKALNSWDARQIRRLVAAVPEVSQLPDGVLPQTAFLSGEEMKAQ